MDSINTEIGNNAEDIFMHTMMQAGYKVTRASVDENMHKHIDFFIEHHGVIQSIDVKQANDSYSNLGIELVNKMGDTGFIFGEATLIAYLSHGSFLIFDRRDLLGFAIDYVSNHPTICCQSPGRKDTFFYIPTHILTSNVMHIVRDIA